MNFIKNEIEKNWHQVIINSRKGYLDLDELKSRLRGAIIRKKVSQKYIDKYKNNKSEYPLEEIVRNENVIKEEEEYIQFLEKEFTYFPPLPVLPPTRPLIKISGVIEEVTFTKAMACFEAGAYRTVQEILARKKQMDNMDAAIVTAVDIITKDPSRAQLIDGKPEKLKCLHVKGKINGKQFSGWFGMTNIRPGDHVEMAVIPDGDNYLVYAVANPEQRTISLTPRCESNGSLSTLKISLLSSFIFCLIIYLPIIFFFDDIELWTTLWYAFISLTFGLYIYKTKKDEHGVHFTLFREISSVLDLPGREKFSLSKAAIQKKKENGWIPRKEGEIPMPQCGGGDYLYEYFYYY